MTTDLNFTTNAFFTSVIYEQDADSWYFSFGDNIYVRADGFWRLLVMEKIVLVSFDNGHQFGLPESIDLVKDLIKHLTGKKLTDILVHKDTADLTLKINDNVKIEIFVSSSGYETYEFGIDEKRYIGLGSGEIGIVETTDNPQFLMTRKL